MELRSRTIPLRLLNKKNVSEQRTLWQVVNVAVPLLVLLLAGIVYQVVRKKKYTA